ncbi:shikimate kinase [Pseudohoeflea coraliihabitans]|uniref:shikimate kinase n=1 Tax=Pseudohoeflea coraliihabitans TaxID=2860393 RepID=UPI003204B6A5
MTHATAANPGRPAERDISRALAALGPRKLVFVGLMGAGKSAIGRLVAQWLQVPFFDSDHEIERASRMSISDLFAAYGEAEFRALEARVIRRLMKNGAGVVSTGGGAYMNEKNRRVIGDKGLAVWLDAELDVLWERVSRRDNRPLLKTEDPKGTLQTLMEARYPVYATAPLRVLSRDAPRETIAGEVISALAAVAAQDTGNVS